MNSCDTDLSTGQPAAQEFIIGAQGALCYWSGNTAITSKETCGTAMVALGLKTAADLWQSGKSWVGNTGAIPKGCSMQMGLAASPQGAEHWNTGAGGTRSNMKPICRIETPSPTPPLPIETPPPTPPRELIALEGRCRGPGGFHEGKIGGYCNCGAMDATDCWSKFGGSFVAVVCVTVQSARVPHILSSCRNGPKSLRSATQYSRQQLHQLTVPLAAPRLLRAQGQCKYTAQPQISAAAPCATQTQVLLL